MHLASKQTGLRSSCQVSLLCFVFCFVFCFDAVERRLGGACVPAALRRYGNMVQKNEEKKNNNSNTRTHTIVQTFEKHLRI